jgi:hypothetical protein
MDLQKLIVEKRFGFLLTVFLLIIGTGCKAEMNCLDPLGCVRLNSTDTPTIAFLLDQSGSYPSISRAINASALTERASHPTLLGHNLNLLLWDAGCIPDRAENLVNNLVANQTILMAALPGCPQNTLDIPLILSNAGIIPVQIYPYTKTHNNPKAIILTPDIAFLSQKLIETILGVEKTGGIQIITSVEPPLQDWVNAICTAVQKKDRTCFSVSPADLANSTAQKEQPALLILGHPDQISEILPQLPKTEGVNLFLYDPLLSSQVQGLNINPLPEHSYWIEPKANQTLQDPIIENLLLSSGNSTLSFNGWMIIRTIHQAVVAAKQVTLQLPGNGLIIPRSAFQQLLIKLLTQDKALGYFEPEFTLYTSLNGNWQVSKP